MRNFWNQRIPTLLGLLIIIAGIGITTFLANQSTIFRLRANLSDQPKDVRITNITDTSFTVSYTTDGQVPGSLNFGQDKNLGQSALDDRDQQSGNLANYNIHNITVPRLTQQTKYYFTITSGQTSYLNNNQAFEVTTGPTLSTPPSQQPITGKVVLPDGTIPTQTIVYVTMDGAQVISTLLKADGSYILPLNSLRTNDLSNYFNPSSDTNIKILVLGNSLSSNASLTLDQAHPIPTITLSKNYNFTAGQTSVNIPTNLASFPSFESTPSAKAAPEILTPKENQSFTDQQPLFKGTGLPDQNVTIVIHSDTPITANVTTDSNGNWSYRPTNPLTPGEHTITITTKNSQGILQTITQAFVVYAQGVQTANAAAPSPTPTPSTTPSLTPTPTVTPTPVVSPNQTPTPIVTFVPTIAPFGSPSAAPTQIQTKGGLVTTPSKTLPPTGNPYIMAAGTVGVIVAALGGLLFLLAL